MVASSGRENRRRSRYPRSRAASAEVSQSPILVGDVRCATSTRSASCELSGGSQFDSSIHQIVEEAPGPARGAPQKAYRRVLSRWNSGAERFSHHINEGESAHRPRNTKVRRQAPLP